MWWEYLIVLTAMALAVSYVFWMVLRAFGGKGGGCCSSGCSTQCGSDHSSDRGLKGTPLVQLRGPK